MSTSENRQEAKQPWGRWAAWVVGGALLIYVGTFIGNVTFYWSFQKTLLAQGEEPGPRDMLWKTPDNTVSCDVSQWQLHRDGDVSFRVPPGKLEEVEAEGEARRVVHEHGKFMVQSFPRGFIGSLLRKESQSLGLSGKDVRSDVEILTLLVEHTPDAYQFGWGERDRTEYAANLLVRMLLFEPIAVKRAVFAAREDSSACSYLVEYENGDTRVLTAGPSGSVIVLFDQSVPAQWRQDPGSWVR